MAFKKIGKVKSFKRTSKNPIRHHKLQNKLHDNSIDKVRDTKKEALTIKEHARAIRLYLKHYGKGVSIANALDHTRKEDIDRAHKQLRAFYLTGKRNGVFRFNVKASGLHDKSSYIVEIQWDTSMATRPEDASEIFKNAPIKYQCSCERHTYWYRYIWTKVKSSLGIQEHRFPRVRNRQLSGMLCKHGVKVFETIQRAPFQKTFARYIENEVKGKQTRMSLKDKAGVAGSSFGSRR